MSQDQRLISGTELPERPADCPSRHRSLWFQGKLRFLRERMFLIPQSISVLWTTSHLSTLDKYSNMERLDRENDNLLEEFVVEAYKTRNPSYIVQNVIPHLCVVPDLVKLSMMSDIQSAHGEEEWLSEVQSKIYADQLAVVSRECRNDVLRKFIEIIKDYNCDNPDNWTQTPVIWADYEDKLFHSVLKATAKLDLWSIRHEHEVHTASGLPSRLRHQMKKMARKSKKRGEDMTLVGDDGPSDWYYWNQQIYALINLHDEPLCHDHRNRNVVTMALGKGARWVCGWNRPGRGLLESNHTIPSARGHIFVVNETPAPSEDSEQGRSSAINDINMPLHAFISDAPESTVENPSEEVMGNLGLDSTSPPPSGSNEVLAATLELQTWNISSTSISTSSVVTIYSYASSRTGSVDYGLFYTRMALSLESLSESLFLDLFDEQHPSSLGPPVDRS